MSIVNPHLKVIFSRDKGHLHPSDTKLVADKCKFSSKISFFGFRKTIADGMMKAEHDTQACLKVGVALFLS